MAQSMTWPMLGILAIAGAGAGIQLGHSAIAEINPIYYSQPPTRFHSDLIANPPSNSPPQIVAAVADDPALGTGCIGCRTYPEEYRPIHEASLDGYSTAYVGEEAAAPPVSEEPDDPEVARLRGDMERVVRYARGSQSEPMTELASAEAEPQEELPPPVQ